jgi:hypothetical protein
MYLRGGTGVVFNNTALQGDATWGWIRVNQESSCEIPGYTTTCFSYPCPGQIGRTHDNDGDGVQDLDPLYSWNNSCEGQSRGIIPNGNPPQPCVTDYVQEGRDYFNNTPKPRYVPYPYPHTLAVQDETGRLLNLRKISSGNQVNLDWDAISGATGYGVSRDWGAVVPIPNTTYTDNNPAQVYIVYAYDSGGKIIAMEGVNTTDSQAPSAPTNLHATAVTSYSVTLVWDASNDNFGVIGYRVYQGAGPVCVANVSGLTATVFNLNAATPYSFTLAAYDAGGNETKSDPVSVTTNAGFTISGQVTLNGAGLVNVVMSGLPTLIFTKANGDYTATVDQGWSGTVRPTLSGYTFTPPSIDYSSGVTANQVDRNYTATASGGGGGSDSGGGGGGGGCFLSAVQSPYSWVAVLGMFAVGLVRIKRRTKEI